MEKGTQMTAPKQEAALLEPERVKDFTCRTGHCASPAACGFEGPCLAGLPPLPERRALPVIGSGIAGHARGYTADQMCEYALAARTALPVVAVPCLTDARIDEIAHAQDEPGEPPWFTAILTQIEWRCFARDIERALLASQSQADERLLEQALAALLGTDPTDPNSAESKAIDKLRMRLKPLLGE
jgi:hypothetical protein